jgi:hypothetical protein
LILALLSPVEAALVQVNTTSSQTISNKTFDSTNAYQGGTFSGTFSGNYKLTAPIFSGSITGTYTLAGIPTISSPTISSPTFAGTASGSLTNLQLITPTIASIVNTGTLTLPTSSDTLIGRATIDTLTNKTLTNPANTTQSLTDGATVNWDVSLGAVATWTIAGNRTIAAPTNLKTGGRYVLSITQDAAGGRTITWNGVYKNAGTLAMPQPVGTPSKTTEYTFTSPDGTNLNLEQPMPHITILAKSAVAVAAPADTNEDTLATITIPANALGANGQVRLTFAYTNTNNGNNKTARVRFSGGAGTVHFSAVTTTQAQNSAVLTLGNRNATNAQVSTYLYGNNGPATQAAAGTTSAVDTTVSTTLLITCQKATAGDSCQLEQYLAELITDGS